MSEQKIRQQKPKSVKNDYVLYVFKIKKEEKKKTKIKNSSIKNYKTKSELEKNSYTYIYIYKGVRQVATTGFKVPKAMKQLN